MSSDHRIPPVETINATRMRGFALVALAVLAISLGCGGGSQNVNGGGGGGPVAASIAGRIAVGTAPSAVAIDSTNNKIYVTDFGTPPPNNRGPCTPSGSDIKLIDGNTQAVTTFAFTFFAPGATWTPYAAAVNPANHTLYAVAALFGPNFSDICSFDSDGIELFDTTPLLKPETLAVSLVWEA